MLVLQLVIHKRAADCDSRSVSRGYRSQQGRIYNKSQIFARACVRVCVCVCVRVCVCVCVCVCVLLLITFTYSFCDSPVNVPRPRFVSKIAAVFVTLSRVSVTYPFQRRSQTLATSDHHEPPKITYRPTLGRLGGDPPKIQVSTENKNFSNESNEVGSRTERIHASERIPANTAPHPTPPPPPHTHHKH